MLALCSRRAPRGCFVNRRVEDAALVQSSSGELVQSATRVVSINGNPALLVQLVTNPPNQVAAQLCLFGVADLDDFLRVENVNAGLPALTGPATTRAGQDGRKGKWSEMGPKQ